MKIAVIGTGFIGGILGGALADVGHEVLFGSRHPDDDPVASSRPGRVVPVGQAISEAEVVILVIPGAAVAELSASHSSALAGKVVIDATNQMGQPIANSRGPCRRPFDTCEPSTRSEARTWPIRFLRTDRRTCSSLVPRLTAVSLRPSSRRSASDPFTSGTIRRRSSTLSSKSGLPWRSNKGGADDLRCV